MIDIWRFAIEDVELNVAIAESTQRQWDDLKEELSVKTDRWRAVEDGRGTDTLKRKDKIREESSNGKFQERNVQEQ